MSEATALQHIHKPYQNLTALLEFGFILTTGVSLFLVQYSSGLQQIDISIY